MTEKNGFDCGGRNQEDQGKKPMQENGSPDPVLKILNIKTGL
jgi:hypothetical protein